LQGERLLGAATRAHRHLERPGPGDRLAARGDADREREGRPRRAAEERRSFRLKILLVGKNGQVGWDLARLLPEARATGRAELDLASADAIRRAVRDARPEIIINAAAYTAVDKAESEPDLAMRINGVAPGVLGEEAKRLGALLVHYSTDYVFDGEKAS